MEEINSNSGVPVNKLKYFFGKNKSAVVLGSMGIIAFFVISLSILVTQNEIKLLSRAASKTSSNIILRAVSVNYWPNNYGPLNFIPPSGWTWMTNINNNKLTFQQPGPTYFSFYASKFIADNYAPFDWKIEGNKSTVRLYGYTTAPCNANITARFQFNPATATGVMSNEGVHLEEYKVLPVSQCGYDPVTGYNWFKIKSTEYFGAFHGGIRHGAIRFHRYDQSNYYWDIRKIVLCNPDQNGSGCAFQAWPPTTPTPTPSLNPVKHKVFVTSNYYKVSDFGSLSGADSICQTRANAAGLTGTYKAWLSTGSTNAKSRIPNVPYELVNGTTVANSIADLTDGSLQNPINKDEFGNTKTPPVWTGTDGYGMTVPYHHCNNWSSSSDGMAAYGTAGYKDSRWTNFGTSYTSCKNAAANIYCFQTTQ